MQEQSGRLGRAGDAAWASKLKQFRAVAARYDKCDFMYQATVDVASTGSGCEIPSHDLPARALVVRAVMPAEIVRRFR